MTAAASFLGVIAFFLFLWAPVLGLPICCGVWTWAAIDSPAWSWVCGWAVAAGLFWIQYRVLRRADYLGKLALAVVVSLVWVGGVYLAVTASPRYDFMAPPAWRAPDTLGWWIVGLGAAFHTAAFAYLWQSRPAPEGRPQARAAARTPPSPAVSTARPDRAAARPAVLVLEDA